MGTSVDYLKYIDYPIIQSDDYLKVTSDTVTLGLFMDKLYGKTILDIGTNTGALLLYAHYRGAKYFIGTDIHQGALDLAKQNISKYTNDFALYCQRVQELDIEPVDAIVCNPPFFESGKNISKDVYKREALFEESLPLSDLFSCFKRLLKQNGEIYLIYKADRFTEVYDLCLQNKFKIMKLQFMHDKNTKYATRFLVKLKYGKNTRVNIERPIIL